MNPDSRTVALVAAWSVICLAATVLREFLWVALLVGGAVALLLAFDAVRARRLPGVTVKRHVARTLPLRNWCMVELEFENPSSSVLDLDLFDHYPVDGEVKDLPVRLVLHPGASGRVKYRFRPLLRGTRRFGTVELKLRSPWRFWQVRRRAGEGTEIRVYPDFGAVRRFAILAVDNSMSRLGVMRKQRRGEGLELRQLREYRTGDSLRQIDWKATSRRTKIISREYEDERNQQVMFLLDCGRNMRAVDNGAAHFDYALNSILLLAYVALRQGDAVGLMTMGKPDRRLEPQKGRGAMNTILRAIFDLEPGKTVPDYVTSATQLMAHQRRRALVIVVTNLRDEDTDEALSAVRLMRRRHLVLLASLRESILDHTLGEPVTDRAAAVRVAATHHYLAARRRVYDAPQRRGVFALDVVPEKLPISILDRYLDIKRSGSL